MFTSEEVKEAKFKEATSENDTSRSSLNDRVDFSLDQSAITKQSNGHAKKVSFSSKSKKGATMPPQTLSKNQIKQTAQEAVQEEMSGILGQLETLRIRTEDAEKGVGSGFVCEDSKLLEAILEHILFHWDDIMACLIDELIEEEVTEQNKIEMMRRRQ